MPVKEWLSMLNPNNSIFAVPGLKNTDTELYFNGNIKTLGDLMALTDDEILSIRGIGKHGLAEIRLAIKKEKEQTYYLANALRREGYPTRQSVISMTVDEILDITGIRFDQIGRILLYQRDFGGRHHKHQELVHVTQEGRIYHCDHCRYRNPDVNFCDFCMQKLLDNREAARKKDILKR